MRWILPLVGVAAALVVAVPLFHELQDRVDRFRRAAFDVAPGPAVAPAPGAARRSPPRRVRVPAAATVYRWRDAAGTLHIESSPPPPGVEAEVLVLEGEREVVRTVPPRSAPARAPADGAAPRGPPYRVYTPSGTGELLRRLDRAMELFEDRRQALEDVRDDL